MFSCFSNIKLLLQANVKCRQLHLSMLCFLVPTGWITYQFSYALRQKFEFFLGQRKAYCIFEGLSNLYWIISPINFFLFFCCLQEKIPNWRNYLFKLQNQAGRNTTYIQTPPDYSAATPKLLVKKFGLKMISALFLIAGIHSTTNLKTYEQAKKFFNSVNAQFSWE